MHALNAAMDVLKAAKDPTPMTNPHRNPIYRDPPTGGATTTITLTGDDLELLCEALDSHEYWQLTEADDRDSGNSMIDDGASAEIDACRKLAARLHEAKGE